jgi:hypothetical protein
MPVAHTGRVYGRRCAVPVDSYRRAASMDPRSCPPDPIGTRLLPTWLRCRDARGDEVVGRLC